MGQVPKPQGEGRDRVIHRGRAALRPVDGRDRGRSPAHQFAGHRLRGVSEVGGPEGTRKIMNSRHQGVVGEKVASLMTASHSGNQWAAPS